MSSATKTKLPAAATDNPVTKTVRKLTQPGSGGVPVKTPTIPKVEVPKLPDPPASVPDPGGVVSGATGAVNDATGAARRRSQRCHGRRHRRSRQRGGCRHRRGRRCGGCRDAARSAVRRVPRPAQSTVRWAA